jgi:hypothetical protein
VAFSPMWLAASAGLMDVASAESAQRLNATAATANLINCIAVSVYLMNKSSPLDQTRQKGLPGGLVG